MPLISKCYMKLGVKYTLSKSAGIAARFYITESSSLPRNICSILKAPLNVASLTSNSASNIVLWNGDNFSSHVISEIGFWLYYFITRQLNLYIIFVIVVFNTM